MPSYFRDPEAPEPNVPRRVGVVALIERDGAILLQRRSDGGDWDFLGGGLDEGETVLEALRREVHEETGLALAEVTLFGVFSDPMRIIRYPDRNTCRLLSIVFHAVPEPGEPVLSVESLELRFVERDELAGLELWPASQPILDAFLSAPGEIVVE